MNIRSVLPPDAIPSIDEPRFGHEYLGEGDEDVIVVESSPPRAYPVRILNFHEIVNDEVNGEPVAITWCPLCGSGVVYERQLDGRVLTFGVSGKLADDDLVMYDRETGSEWKQSLGECIDGPLEGAVLEVRPASMITWDQFRDRYPAGIVLQPDYTDSEAASDDDEPAPVDYSMEPYNAYFESDGFGLASHRGEDGARTWDREDIEPKTVVLGISRGGEAIGFPQPQVEASDGTVTATVGGERVVVISVNGGIHAFEDPGFSLEVIDGEVQGDGTRWDPVTGASVDDRRLKRIGGRRLFAFTWQDDHGPDAFFLTDE